MKAKRRKIVNTLAISLIMKHDNLLKIGYMNPATTLREAFYDEEKGWKCLFVHTEDFNPQSPADIQSAFIAEYSEMIKYHKKVCGGLCSVGDTGCGSECDIFDCDIKYDVNFQLSYEEASILFNLLTSIDQLEDTILDLEYTHARLNAILGMDANLKSTKKSKII